MDIPTITLLLTDLLSPLKPQPLNPEAPIPACRQTRCQRQDRVALLRMRDAEAY